MPFVETPNIVMVEIRATLAGQSIENRIMVGALTTPTTGIVDEIAQLVFDWASTQYFDWLSHDVFLTEVVATDLTVQNGYQKTVVSTPAQAGSVNQGAMPNEVTFCVSLRSGVRGRSARGRMYMLALPHDEVANNTLSGVWVAGFVSSVQILIDTLAAAGRPLTIVSYRTNNAPRSGGPVYFLVQTALAVDNTVDSMKSRKPGVGN